MPHSVRSIPRAWATDWHDFSQRLGLAWNPAALKAMLIRVGAGIYYSAFPWVYAPDSLLNGSPIGAGASFMNPLTNPGLVAAGDRVSADDFLQIDTCPRTGIGWFVIT